MSTGFQAITPQTYPFDAVVDGKPRDVKVIYHHADGVKPRFCPNHPKYPVGAVDHYQVTEVC